jgi:DNA-binding CsgD family transcriptional regulator
VVTRKTPSRDLDDAVVQGLYEAAAGTTPWKIALAALDDAVGATSGSQLVVVDKSNGQVILSEQPDHTSPDGVLDYMREYHRFDPHVPYIASRQVGEVTHTADTFPAAEYEDHPFYRDFWRPYNVRSFVGTKIAEDEQRTAVIALMRSLDQPLYTPQEVALAGRYLRHLTAAVRIAQYLRKVKTSAIVGYGLMEGSDRPMILLDDQRSVLASNTAARVMLGAGDFLFARNGVLYCRAADGQRKLEQALAPAEHPAGTPADRTTGKRVGLQLALTNGAKVLCSVWYLEPETTMGVFGPQPAALLTIALSSADKAVDPIFLASLFDFTPAEVRIATSLIRGVTLRQIAADRGLSIETVRSHLRVIFSKTHTHRQAELVQCLLRATTV